MRYLFNNNLNNNNPNNNNLKSLPLDIIKKIRNAWGDHVIWERSFIISTADDLGDLEDVTQRLQQHPKGTEIYRIYYGIENANILEQLLRDHLALEMQLINELKVGNAMASDITRSKLYQNADDIAEIFSNINPNWDKNEFQSMLYTHLDMTEEEAELRFRGQYADDIALYDEIKAQAFDIADIMAEGIIKQFNL